MLAQLQGQKTCSNGHYTDQMQLQFWAHVQWREDMLMSYYAMAKGDNRDEICNYN